MDITSSERSHLNTSNLQILDEDASMPLFQAILDGKENLDPSSLQRHSHEKLRRPPAIPRVDTIDQELTQFKKRIDKLRSSLMSGESIASSRRRFKREDAPSTLRVEDVIELEDSQPIAEDIVDSQAYRSKEIVQSTSSEAKSFKRRTSSAQSEEKQLNQSLELKRENHKLRQELERLRLEHEASIAAERARILEENSTALRELESEHQILIEGLRQDYHEIINNLKLQSKHALM
jgi:hypothetical protein